MSDLTVKALSSETWADFASLVETNNGVWGGCWCMWYHGKEHEALSSVEKREAKRALVSAGQACAALVYSGADCVGWCQYGPVDTLPRIHNQRAYEQAKTPKADWRITCVFVGKGHRRSGVAKAALAGAVAQIRARGGGLIEAFPEDAAGRKVTSGFLFNGVLGMFDDLGFSRQERIGKHKWVVTIRV